MNTMKQIKNIVSTLNTANKTVIVKIVIILLLYILISIFLYLVFGILFK